MAKQTMKVLPILKPYDPDLEEAKVVLNGIDEIEAACVMAIVAHETGISLDELTFKSIKRVED